MLMVSTCSCFSSSAARRMDSASTCRLHIFMEPRTPGFSSQDNNPASSSTFTCIAAEDAGMCSCSAISFTFICRPSSIFKISRRTSEDRALPTSVSSRLFSYPNTRSCISISVPFLFQPHKPALIALYRLLAASISQNLFCSKICEGFLQ